MQTLTNTSARTNDLWVVSGMADVAALVPVHHHESRGTYEATCTALQPLRHVQGEMKFAQDDTRIRYNYLSQASL